MFKIFSDVTFTHTLPVSSPTPSVIRRLGAIIWTLLLLEYRSYATLIHGNEVGRYITACTTVPGTGRTYVCTRVVPKVMSNFFFLHANWEQQTKESEVVDGTSCCVILECLVTSVACITWLVSLLTKWPTTICPFASVLSSNSLWKRRSLLQKFTRDFSVLMEVCAWVRAVFEDGWNILKMGKDNLRRRNWTFRAF